MAGGGAVHVRGLELHLAGGDGCVELDLSPVHDVEHQADADDDLRRTGRGDISRLRSELSQKERGFTVTASAASADLQGEHKVAAEALLGDHVLHGPQGGAQIGVEKLSGQQAHRGGHQVVWQRHVCDLKAEKQLTQTGQRHLLTQADLTEQQLRDCERLRWIYLKRSIHLLLLFRFYT